MDKNCIACKQNFEVDSTHKNQKYCSRKCWKENAIITASHNSHLAWNKGKTGYSTSKKGKSYAELFGVKKALEVRRKLIISHLGKKPVCSWKKGETAKEKHWNWKGGITKRAKRERNNSLMNKWKKAVLAKDNFECQGCGIDKKLQAHHILSYEKNPEYRAELWNGQALCKDCHEHLHNELGWK